MRLYADLASWYPLFTPLADYAEEAEWYRAPLLAHLGPGPHRLLELGCGAGHNAHYLARDFTLTLVDPAPAMLAIAARSCPDATLLQGDMRDLRLNRTFDAVFVHDAIVYMLDEAELRAALLTAFLHTRPGGVAVFAPDAVQETFRPGEDCGGSDGDGRSVRYLEWTWQREGQPERIVVDYTLVVREGEGPAVAIATDRHEEGLFSRATWMRLLREVGFVPEDLRVPYEDRELDVFVAVRAG